MKKIVRFIFIIFCLSFFLSQFTVHATEDGSLKINTNIQTTPQSSGIHYIEQESELSALFRIDTTANIQKQQEQIKQEEQQGKQQLFIEESSSQRLVDAYIVELFNTNTIVARSENQQFTMNADSSFFSVPMFVVLLVAGIIMGYSVIRVITVKKG